MKRPIPRVLAAFAVVMAASLHASAQMPDPKQMSGVPLPVADLPVGTVTIRVVRGALTNVIPNHPVDLIAGAAPVTAKTNDAGRAEFTALVPGTRVRAMTTVDGERVVSQEFEVPRAGGVRMLLVATDPGMAKNAAEDQKRDQAAAHPGSVVLGEESRFVFEIGDDGLNVFSILQILNSGRTPVQTPPIVFDLPDGAEHAAVLQGSSPQAVAAGKRVTVTGPFAPGPTLVQFAYSFKFRRSEMTFEQKLPVPMRQLQVLIQKIGEMHVASEQFAQHRDLSHDGKTYIMAQGPALKTGDTITLAFTGLPAPAVWPRNLALALASSILAGGAWLAARPRRDSDGQKAAAELQARRDRLFHQLTDLEQQHQIGAVDPDRYAERRRELIGDLERVYAELDTEAAA
jgi:hypothetical protein